MKKRNVIYYLPLLQTEDVIRQTDFTITPFLKNKEYSHLLPMDVFDGTGSLVEFDGFESGDPYTHEIDRKILISLERLKFSYFLQNPNHSTSIDGYVSSETFECFRCIEPNEDPAFEHKVNFSNGMYNFSKSLKTYYASRISSRLRPIKLTAWDFDYVDYLSDGHYEEGHLAAMRLYNRCWSTYSLHNSIDKPVLARASIEVLAKIKFRNKPLVRFIPYFFETAFLKLDQLGEVDATVRRLTALIIPIRNLLQDSVTKEIESITEARHTFAHEGIESESLINIPFYLVWFPLYWMVLFRFDEMTTKDGVRLALFFCLLKVKPECWQYIERCTPATQIKRHHLDTYAHYSRLLQKWSEERPEEANSVLCAIPQWFGIDAPRPA